MNHKAGFVSIIGRPNVGKSTLMNQWLGEKLSIVSPKAQTTRHRVLGIFNDDAHQIVFSDTPGIIFDPANELHISMNKAVEDSLEDADVLIYLAEFGEKPENLLPIFEKLKNINTHKVLILNKSDLLKNSEEAMQKLRDWESLKIFDRIFPVSALYGANTNDVLLYLCSVLPENPPYYPKDQLTDRNLRFFVAEIIREKILLFYHKEIPYSVQVEIDEYKEQKDIDRIRAIIYTERESQKNILIGKGGEALKKVWVEARKDIERLIDKHVYLELDIKNKDNTRNDPKY